jgi:hypothetical protein
LGVLWTDMQNITSTSNDNHSNNNDTISGRGRRLVQLTTAAVAAIAALVAFGATAEASEPTDSFSFGVEREMKESGEKGGTGDINIGVGELQECTISKSMDSTSPTLAQYAINGNSTGDVDGADFNVWQQNYGQTAATGDFDGDGDVDGSDYVIWRRTVGA